MIKKILENREFVYLASADKNGRPNVAPKFLAKVGPKELYLVDFVAGQTWENVQKNPRAAVSFMDPETLHGYLLRGPVTTLTAGAEFEEITRIFQDKQLSLIVSRVAEGVSRAKRHKDFGIALPQKGGVIKFRIEEVIEIGAGGVSKEKIFNAHSYLDHPQRKF